MTWFNKWILQCPKWVRSRKMHTQKFKGARYYRLFSLLEAFWRQADGFAEMPRIFVAILNKPDSDCTVSIITSLSACRSSLITWEPDILVGFFIFVATCTVTTPAIVNMLVSLNVILLTTATMPCTTHLFSTSLNMSSGRSLVLLKVKLRSGTPWLPWSEEYNRLRKDFWRELKPTWGWHTHPGMRKAFWNYAGYHRQVFQIAKLFHIHFFLWSSNLVPGSLESFASSWSMLDYSTICLKLF